MSDESAIVYVTLVEEGQKRPVPARRLSADKFQLLGHGMEEELGEEWEFSAGSVVTCERRTFQGQDYYLAVALTKG